MHADVEMPQILPAGTIPEEERAAQLFTTDAGPPKDLGPAWYSKGPRPCFCCGKDGHSWIACPKKVSGKCGVCGSQEHPTFRCHRRFQPAPESRVNYVVSLPTDKVPTGIRTLDPLDLSPTPVPGADEEEEDQEVVTPTTPAACNHVRTAEHPEIDNDQPTNPGLGEVLARILEPGNMKALPGLRSELPREAIKDIDMHLAEQGGVLTWLHTVAIQKKGVCAEQQVRPI